MAEILIGNIKGPQGIRGTQWFYGTGITGNSTAAAVFPASGVENAYAGDFYLSTAENSIGNTYMCVVAGDASTAQWVYAGNIRGPRGIQGIQGEPGPMQALINNFLTTEAGLGAADAVTVATLKKEIDEVDNSLGQILSATINGTYYTNLTQCAGIILPKGIYIAIGNVVTGGICRDIQLLNDSTQFARSYGGDSVDGNVCNVIGIIVNDSSTDLIMKISMKAESAVTGYLKAIRLK